MCLAFLAVLGYVVDRIVIGDPQNPYLFNTLEAQKGMPLYKENCQMCHGKKAVGATAPALNYDAVWRYGVSDWEKFQNVRQGIAATDMPSFKNLTDDETWQILSYVNNTDYIPDPDDEQADESADSTAEDGATEAGGDEASQAGGAAMEGHQ